MSLADKVTSLRVILAPIFFVLYLLEEIYLPILHGRFWVFAVLWILFIIIECTDWLDGLIARSRNEVSDFGKLYDPFADTLVRISYFLCFIFTRVLPVVPFLVILFREFGILFLRVLMMQKGVAMGARKGGKLKAVSYAFTGFACLLSVSLERFGYSDMAGIFRKAGFIIFILSMLIAIASFMDYFSIYFKTTKSK